VNVELNLRDTLLDQLGPTATLAEELGFDGLAQPETRHDPFVALTVAGAATSRTRLATAVALAFPRSPMTVAYLARDLQDLSHGRFALGLGTQVKGHIERRFSVEWSRPGPRLRDYIQALRAIWECWQQGTPLHFEGEFYRFSLMTPEFSPGPSVHDPIPVHLAAVNPYLLRTAGELADGLRCHSFSTPEYIRDVIWPNVLHGANRVGRPLDGFEMIAGGLAAVGPDEEAVSIAREAARRRIALYASTRTYLPVLEHHGWEGINAELRALIAAERWGDLPLLVPDDMLDAFCISGTYATFPVAARTRLAGLVDTISLPLTADAGEHRDQIAAAIAALKTLHGADAYRRQAAGSAPAQAERGPRLPPTGAGKSATRRSPRVEE
jgi:probable F420-dependent oxidoreductase